jgi:hypothetical protein
MSCISDSTADGFLLSRLEVKRHQELLTHLDECRECRDALVRRIISIQSLPKNPCDSRPVPTHSDLGETREWRSGEVPEKLDLLLGPPGSDCDPVRALVEVSLAQLPTLSASTER